MQADKSNTNSYKRNHYVPQFYLRYWCNNNKLWVYNNLVPYPTWKFWRQDGTKNLAYINNFYTEKKNDKSKIILEKIFSKKLESEISYIYDKIIQKNFEIDYATKYKFIQYLIIQYLRTPMGYIRLRDVYDEKFIETSKEFINNIKNNTRAEFLPIKTRKLNAPIKIEIHNENITLTSIFDRTTYIDYLKHILKDNLIKNIVNKNWIILYAPNGCYFPTSDNPVAVYKRDLNNKYSYNVFPADYEAEIIFPLTPECILYTNNDEQLSRFNNTQISLNKYNYICEILSNNAYMSIFANSPRIDVMKYSPRTIDQLLYQEKSLAMKNWFINNNIAEKKFGQRFSIDCD